MAIHDDDAPSKPREMSQQDRLRAAHERYSETKNSLTSDPFWEGIRNPTDTQRVSDLHSGISFANNTRPLPGFVAPVPNEFINTRVVEFPPETNRSPSDIAYQTDNRGKPTYQHLFEVELGKTPDECNTPSRNNKKEGQCNMQETKGNFEFTTRHFKGHLKVKSVVDIKDPAGLTDNPTGERIVNKIIYFNYSNTNLIIKDRHDIPQLILPERNKGHNKVLVIRKIFSIPNQKAFDYFYDFLSREYLNDKLNDSLRVLWNKIDAIRNANINGNINTYFRDKFNSEIYIDYTYDVSEFEKFASHRTFKYIAEVDAIITPEEGSGYVHHPFSNRSIIDSIIYETEHHLGWRYNIAIVDNEEKYGPRYFWLNGEVVRITPFADPRRKTGVYIQSCLANDVETEKYHSMSVEEAEEKLILFKTSDEADTNGNPTLKHQKEIEILKRDSEKMKQENAVLQEELNKRKSVRQDYYESRSYERKDTSEIMKFVPSVIAGVVAIGAAVFFNMQKK